MWFRDVPDECVLSKWPRGVAIGDVRTKMRVVQID